MRDPITISRASVKSNEASFKALKAKGLALAQQISGDSWTDYNAHDPGVTILEQLCYAITELTFHTDFNVADLLLNDDGVLDYRAQLLHRPEEIFPCRPTTIIDLRKSLLDEVKEIDNIWLSVMDNDPAGAGRGTLGLYHAEIRRVQGCDMGDDELIEKVVRVFNHNRNLCEDLASVTVLKDEKCILHAKIEVDNSRQANELLARLYFKCDEYVSGDVPLSSYVVAAKEGAKLEQLFNGPLTKHGVFDFSGSVGHEISVSTLFSIINSIEGVDHIKGLHLELDGEKIYETMPRRHNGNVISLAFPEYDVAVKVELYRNGGALPVSFDVVRKRYHEMHYRRDSMREVKQDFSTLYSLPKGKNRGLGNYTSIQQQFPAIYGINHFGVSDESVAKKARARQLKSYLLMFEQLMANFSATTAQLNKLYSCEDERRQSYDYKIIEKNNITDVELIYPHNPGEKIAAILSKYDDYFDRKGRVLDYLLALYGQKFTQNTLRYFNYYYQGDELDEVVIKNKIACLDAIVKFDRDRSAGYNALVPSWNTTNTSGLQFKLSILLGFRHMEVRSLTLPLVKLGLKVVSHGNYRAMNQGGHELKMISLNDIQENFADEFHSASYQISDEFEAVKEIAGNFDAFVPLKNNMISDALLRGGVSLNRFKVGSLAPDSDYQLVFSLNDECDWWYVGRADTREAGNHNVKLLHRFLTHLNIESEGLHLIEHLLLRPLCETKCHDLSDIDPSTFYSARITVIFPDWTARCHDSNFRALAEEIVRSHCPAHIYADVYWLDFDAMYHFELLYKCWLDARMATDLVYVQSGLFSSVDIDAAAKALVRFLCEQQGGHE